MTSTDFTVKILGDKSNAKKVVDQFGDDLGKASSKWGGALKNAASTAGGVLAALGIQDVTQKVMDFGQQSVDAFKEAEQSQALLEEAYKKFPALADTNIGKLRELNTALQAKTGYDDDQIAASQASLAQFGLTGDQISKLTPLMLDYAAKTGKDLPSAAEALGKAVLGQGRGLKAIGVNFKDTGDAAGNFDQLMGALGDKVGGTAEAMGKTGAGQAKILEATFGDLQESIGEKLLPVITSVQSFLVTDLIPAFAGLIGWISENAWVFAAVGGAILAFLVPAMIAWTTSVWASTVALLANPVVWIALAIMALIAVIVLLVMNWDAVVAWIVQVWGGFIGWITDGLNAFGAWWNQIWAGFASWITDVWNGFIGWIQDVWNGFVGWLTSSIDFIVGMWNAYWTLVALGFSLIWSGIVQFAQGVWNGFVGWIQGAVGWVGGIIQTGMTVVSDAWNNTWMGLGGIVRGIWNGILGYIEDGINGVIDLINGMIGAVNNVTGVVGIPAIGLIGHVGFPRLATGTVTDGPMFALIGDNPGGREVVAPLDTYLGELRNAAGVGASAARVSVSTPSGPVELGDKTISAIVGGVVDAIRLGSKQAITTALRR